MDNIKRQKKMIDRVLASYKSLGGINYLDGDILPSRQSINKILVQLIEILFPGYLEGACLDAHNLPYVTGQKIVATIDALSTDIASSLWWQVKEKQQKVSQASCQTKAREIAYTLVENIPDLRKQLKDDIDAIYKGDPAAASEPEIILAYPGFRAIVVYRIAHLLFQEKVPLIPRLMTEIAHSYTGIDIHPGAKIGKRFCIDHGTGVVIGETAVIGNNVKLYQGVTIGALSVKKQTKSIRRHPTIEDDVTVYARTTILGGDTVIGKGSIIGGNVWITSSIPAGSKIYQSTDYKRK